MSTSTHRYSQPQTDKVLCWHPQIRIYNLDFRGRCLEHLFHSSAYPTCQLLQPEGCQSSPAMLRTGLCRCCHPDPLGPAAPCGVFPVAGTQTQSHVGLAGGPWAWSQNGDLTRAGDCALEIGTLGHRGWQDLNLCMGCPEEGNIPFLFVDQRPILF